MHHITKHIPSLLTHRKLTEENSNKTTDSSFFLFQLTFLFLFLVFLNSSHIVDYWSFYCFFLLYISISSSYFLYFSSLVCQTKLAFSVNFYMQICIVLYDILMKSKLTSLVLTQLAGVVLLLQACWHTSPAQSACLVCVQLDHTAEMTTTTGYKTNIEEIIRSRNFC